LKSPCNVYCGDIKVWLVAGGTGILRYSPIVTQPSAGDPTLELEEREMIVEPHQIMRLTLQGRKLIYFI